MASMSLRRVIAAPSEQIFAAFTVPDEIKKWHVPGPDFTVCIAEVDLRVGGRFRIGMQPPDREAPHTFYGVYRQIEPSTHLVYTSNWEPPDQDTGESLVTIEFEPSGDATQVSVTHDLLPDQESADNHTHGWTGTLESLGRHFS